MSNTENFDLGLESKVNAAMRRNPKHAARSYESIMMDPAARAKPQDDVMSSVLDAQRDAILAAEAKRARKAQRNLKNAG